MIQYVYQTTRSSFSAEFELGLLTGSLEKTLAKIAFNNPDNRVFPYLFPIFLEVSSQNNQQSPSVNESLLINCSQSYLNHVSDCHGELEELEKRIAQLHEIRADLSQLLLDGVVDQADPVLFAVKFRRWELVKRLLGFAIGQRIQVSKGQPKKKAFDLYQSLASMPWQLYGQFSEHYVLPELESDEILGIWDVACTTNKLDRRVLISILGHPRTFGGSDDVAEQKKGLKRDKVVTAQLIEHLFDSFTACIAYQLDGWLLETLDWLHRVFSVKGHLSRYDPKYPTYTRIQQFHVFLRFFMQCIEDTTAAVEQPKSLKRKASTDDIVEAVKATLSAARAKTEMLRVKVGWMLQYLVPHVTSHPDIQNVIMVEASVLFIFNLIAENPSLNLLGSH